MNRDELLCLFEYKPETGELYWKDRANRRNNGRAGCVNSHGYRTVTLRHKQMPEHRIIWTIERGEIPSGMVIDHINGIKNDNRVENLRLSTTAQNVQNQRRPHVKNTSGRLGVSFNTQKRKFKAQIAIGGKSVFLGLFSSADDASEAYLAAKRRLHEFCTV